LIEFPGGSLLADPMLSARIMGLWPRLKPPGLRVEDLPPVDAVLISHPHLDHMDIPTLRRLSRDATLIVPRDTAKLAKTLGYRETAALDEWDSIEPVAGLKIVAVPAIHVGIRGMGLGATARGALGYVVETAEGSVYFAGDTAYGPHFIEIRERLSPDVAMLPIGAFVPWLLMKHFHMGPQTALQAFVDLGAEWFVPHHYGTFILSLEAARAPLRLLRREVIRRNMMDQLVIVRRGKTAVFTDGKPDVKPYRQTWPGISNNTREVR